jgi:hypothetical protein
MRTLPLVLALALCGCTRNNLVIPDDADAGQPADLARGTQSDGFDVPPSCHLHPDEKSCALDGARGCHAYSCCGYFQRCLDPGEDTPPCPFSCPFTCHGLDEKSCRQHTQCRVDTCPGCNGGAMFAGCADPTDPPNDCAPPPPCAPCQGMDQQGCEARSDCHGVYDNPGNCFAPPCEVFVACAPGLADCTGPALCAIASPQCDPPYVIGYTLSCYEGCVLKSKCR